MFSAYLKKERGIFKMVNLSALCRRMFHELKNSLINEETRSG